MSAVVYDKSSPYYGTAQVTKYVNYLDFWKGVYILPQSTDSLVKLDARYHIRPDLLSSEVYGTPNLWWIFMLRNPNVIKDPIYDFVTGIMIYVPRKDTLSRFV
jgi:Base plate wedge protein 53